MYVQLEGPRPAPGPRASGALIRLPLHRQKQREVRVAAPRVWPTVGDSTRRLHGNLTQYYNGWDANGAERDERCWAEG